MAGIVGAAGGAETARGSVEPFPKEMADVIAVAESTAQRHFADRQIRVPQQLHRARQAQLLEIFRRGFPRRIAEMPEEIAARHIHQPGERLHPDGIRQVVVHVTNRLTDQILHIGMRRRRGFAAAQFGNQLHEERQPEKHPPRPLGPDFRRQTANSACRAPLFRARQVLQRLNDLFRRGWCARHHESLKERHSVAVEQRKCEVLGIVNQIDQPQRFRPVVPV